MRFQNKVAIVTGAGSGIGLAVAERLGSEGAHLVLADLDAARLEDAVAQCKASAAPGTLPVVCDVGVEQQVVAAVAAAIQQFGRLDVVVNNAGLMLFAKIEDQTEEDWLRVLRVDLLGAFFFTREAFRNMVAGGAIVNVASIHALATSPMVAPYAAAKAGLLSLTRSASIEGKAKSIRVNAVLPGAVEGPRIERVLEGRAAASGRSVAEERAAALSNQSVKRFVAPEEIGALAVFLASDAARSISGQIVPIDGDSQSAS